MRTQITIDAEMQQRAHARAAELGISFAEYVRRLLSQDLGEPRGRADISLVFNLVTDGPRTNVAQDKGKMLADSVWSEHLRTTTRKRSTRSGK